MFQGTGVVITDDGKCHLGSALGTDELLISYVQDKVSSWVGEIEKLLSHNHRQHMRPSHMCFCTVGCILLVQCQCLMTSTVLLSLRFLPTLTGQSAFGPTERELLSLPARLGGLWSLFPPSTFPLTFNRLVMLQPL